MLAFSIEASHKRGLGHLYRSITLAKYLRYKSIFFINKNLKSFKILKKNKIRFKVMDRTKKINFKNLINQHSVKIWINDKLETNKLEGQKISSLVSFVTFDDWGKGSMFAKLNISPLYFGKKKLFGKKVLAGTKYLPLEKNSKYTRTRKKINKILISMGGSDTHNVTLKILDYLKKKKFSATVICGPAFKLNNGVKNYKKDFKINYNVVNIYKEFFDHDILICGGGMTPFEAASTGLPSIVIASEPFEIPVCKKLEKMGISKFIGYHKKINFEKIDLNLDIKKMSNICINRIKKDGLKIIKKNLASLLK